ncbi:membrane protein [Marinobacterium nitratireducens]|uniref:Membrane protein n=1 Tax=Marinobacterium nitratireducens TaxID=518897 RepID=A0A917ZNV2_9GAMM|nr:metal-dependent hydrolase [Marinobacterium nitratireducens]GGO87178.1 membrane protein [Marinobacterium nitratireducens]
MADFKTHTTVAAALSAPLAATAAMTGFADMREAVIYALAGTLGGLLPDIDADDSISIRLVFRLFGALAAGLVVLFWMTTLPHWQVLILAAAAFLLVLYPLRWLFEQYTVHRGLLHSLLANLLFAAVSVLIGYHLFGLGARAAWGVAGFVFFGATVHLLLDEIYSVDLSGMRVKRSFGTALKLTDWGQPLASMGLLLATLVGIWLSPDTDAWHPAFAWLPELALADWFERGVNTLRQLWS